MFLPHIVFAVCCCATINHVLVRSHQFKMRQEETEEEEEEKKGVEVDVHTFVALIDIIFTDYSKRTCTGTIIHDNVVITAAHCFNVENKPHLQPELTASFVVIGTKKMFETKYEQYLPIERVVTHPKYRGWTADLALVYTFSGMTSDKPGTTIPLDGERTSTPVDSNVTVLSWGVCLDDDQDNKKATKMDRYNYGNDNGYDCDSDGVTMRSLRNGNKELNAGSEDTAEIVEETTHRLLRPMYRYAQIRGHQYNLAKLTGSVTRTNTPPSSAQYQSRYLTSGEALINNKSYKRQSSSRENNSSESSEGYATPSFSMRARENHYTRKRKFKSKSTPKSGYRVLYHNWRRSMGSQENKLTVDVFGFVNMQACKKMVERAMPSLYEIRDSNDVVCYASEEHYITAEDSGAPAIRLGHLVAVTVGGAECDGDHVAIGMKMSCYCSWIAENLPSGASKMKCCKNCCDVKHTGEAATSAPADPGRSYFHKKRI